jgi:hypothetical protein
MIPAIGRNRAQRRKKQSRRHPGQAALSIQIDRQSGKLQVDGLRAAAILLDRERHFGAFFKRRKAGAFDCGNVDEDILAAIFRRDETESTGRVEKLYGAILAHGDNPFPHVGRKDRTCHGIRSSKVGKGILAGFVRLNGPAAVLTECPRMGRSNIPAHQHFAFGLDRPETQ